jgi:signal peptidase I
MIRRVIATGIVTLLWTVLILVAVTAVVGRTQGYRLFAVRTGSMAPALGVGDLIIDREVPADSLRPGQLVTFRDPDLGRQLVTHRIVSIQRGGAELRFTSKGDANKTVEHWEAPNGSHLGKTIAHLPWVGRWLLQPRRWATVAAVVIVSLIGGLGLLVRLGRYLFPGTSETSPIRQVPGSASGRTDIAGRHRSAAARCRAGWRSRRGRRLVLTSVPVAVLLALTAVEGTRSAWVVTDAQSASSFTTQAAFASATNFTTCSGTAQTLPVPAGFTTATIDAEGGQGGAGSSTTPGAGGNGAGMQATFAVSGGQTLNVFVGCQGVAGTGTRAGGAGYSGGGAGGALAGSGAGNGGGGGGASAVCIGTCGTATLQVVAGGGGGGGGGVCVVGSGGTGGGGNSASNGATSSPAGTYYTGNNGTSGTGTGFGTGGGGGGHASTPPTSGAAGGNASLQGPGGGGGGGGYNGATGGTAGANSCATGGGGGGAGSSWYASGVTFSSTTNASTGDGTVSITLN